MSPIVTHRHRLAFALVMIASTGCSKPAATPPPMPQAVAGPITNFPSPLPGKQATLVPVGYWQASDPEKLKMLKRLAGNNNTTDCLPTLVQLLQNDPNPNMKDEILGLLGGLDDPRALPSFIAFASPGQPKELRLSAIEAINTADVTNAVTFLRTILADPDAEIREAASFQMEWLLAPPLKDQLRQKPLGKTQATMPHSTAPTAP